MFTGKFQGSFSQEPNNEDSWSSSYLPDGNGDVGDWGLMDLISSDDNSLIKKGDFSEYLPDGNDDVGDWGLMDLTCSDDDSLIENDDFSDDEEDDDFFDDEKTVHDPISANGDERTAHNSILANLDMLLIESNDDRKLMDEFYEKVKNVKEKYRQTESALNRIQYITDKYLEKGIRLNLCYSNCGKTVTNLIFEEITGILDNIVRVRSSTTTSKGGYSYSDADGLSINNLDTIQKIVESLLLKGGKVRRDLFYHDEMQYATEAFMNNENFQFDDHIYIQCQEVKDELKILAYGSVINKSNQIKSVLRICRDNKYFFIEYSHDSAVEPAKITSNPELKFYVLQIGKSIVTVKSVEGKRNYTDILESSIKMTFTTEVGEVNIQLSPSDKNSNKIRVEISDEDRKNFDQLKNKKEIGEDCLLGGYSVYDAIKQGYFEKHKKLCQFSENAEKIVKEDSQNSGNYWVNKIQLSRENSMKCVIHRGYCN
ncbi:hypothetical protein [Wolbachia endosymbiont of Nilaparvata lugens]|uniref:hypothetical protein n=1 Tax=Wolbachia endosymbiont of Nilaparvata lugens TaxID=357143 RepID=UPI001180021A|nr:hypothetical protein [Wolbachia endosymbiont of Nilaparvata lugens]